ncbi:MAG: Dam family site-specific DNA-(adenine-N6)-methyltransferase [Stenomitos rutilans HA7619-LM2]|jgi:DNA adenine methylase|nr:Dam family site-specific DNA-(adenine-N6)-methyltransferase [Stenomitos rutilans HA7619-LM2]
MHVKVPPIKCQGIKTKLVPFILSHIQWTEQEHARWIEPFLGSGVVVFNLAPKRALLTDTNQHIIAFYQSIQKGGINRSIVSNFLKEQGDRLLKNGADHYYEVRDRFNQFSSPLDFLFLNRACFNGLMRFNSKGGFNVPFCHKPQRFAQSYITKIANQVDWVAKQMAGNDWEFRVANWQETLIKAQPDDFVYLDPPYIGRHTDYYNAWNLAEAERLATVTKQLPCGFAVSMWLENQHRQNSHIQACWSDLEMHICQHFYHVGSREALRGAIEEALLIKPGFSANLDTIPSRSFAKLCQ